MCRSISEFIFVANSDSRHTGWYNVKNHTRCITYLIIVVKYLLSTSFLQNQQKHVLENVKKYNKMKAPTNMVIIKLI